MKKESLTQVPLEPGVAVAIDSNVKQLLTVLKISALLAEQLQKVKNIDPEIVAATTILRQSVDNAGVVLEKYTDHHLSVDQACLLLQSLNISAKSMEANEDISDDILVLFQLLGNSKKKLHVKKYQALIKFLTDQVRADINNQPQLVWFKDGHIFFKQAGEIPAQIAGE